MPDKQLARSPIGNEILIAGVLRPGNHQGEYGDANGKECGGNQRMDKVTSVYRWHRRLFTTLSSPVSGHLSPVTFGLLPGISAALRQDDRPYDILRIPGEIHRIGDDV